MPATTIVPIGKFIAMRAKKKEKSSLVLPQNIAKKVDEGDLLEVIATGKDCTKGIQKGDILCVIHPNLNIVCIKYEGDEVYITNEDFVCAALRSA